MFCIGTGQPLQSRVIITPLEIDSSTRDARRGRPPKECGGLEDKEKDDDNNKVYNNDKGISLMGLDRVIETCFFCEDILVQI